MTRIACLHTAQSNVAVLEAAAMKTAREDLSLSHEMRHDLLADMEAAGSLTPEIRARGLAAINALLVSNDGVLITCSSIGALADGKRVQRVDAALAHAAVGQGGRVVVLCASPTTLVPTTDLFAVAAAETGASLDVRMIEGAWSVFRSGDIDGYHQAIANAAQTAPAEGADVVALAQVSMSGAADLVTDARGRIMAAPTVALRAMLDSVG